jgi:hypothetical protein
MRRLSDIHEDNAKRRASKAKKIEHRQRYLPSDSNLLYEVTYLLAPTIVRDQEEFSQLRCLARSLNVEEEVAGDLLDAKRLMDDTNNRIREIINSEEYKEYLAEREYLINL